MAQKLDSLKRPVFDERALLIAVSGHEDVNATVYGNGKGPSGPRSPGLQAIIDYVKRDGSKAAFDSLFLPTDRTVKLGDRLTMDLIDPTDKASALRTRYRLRLNRPEDARQLLQALEGDDTIAVRDHPVIQYPVDDVVDAVDVEQPVGTLEDDDLNDETDALWGLKRCRFPKVWAALDAVDDAHPIAMIDQGRNNGHPVLARRIDVIQPNPPGAGTGVDHASQVASVIGARRGVDHKTNMAGACSAKLALYDVWTDQSDFDFERYYAALRHIVANPPYVVNISLASEVRDPIAERLIREATARGVVFVAAVGNQALRGNPKLYPAAQEGVIGVGATDFNDDRFPTSCFGDHVFISAPGERILAVHGGFECKRQTGTSYAAAFVTAAVWLMKRKHPEWTVKEVKEALQRTADRTKVTGHARRNNDVGCGRLNAQRLAAVL